jgi:hypothetical protein
LIKSSEYDDDYAFSIGFIALMGTASSICFWIGGLASYFAIDKISALGLQLQGFIMTAVSFFMITLSKTLLPKTWWPLCVTLYAFSFLFYGYGPAPTTFLIPGLLFYPNIRTTANGVAAAVGKVGAILGLFMGSSYVGLDISNLMSCFGAVSLMGSAATLLLIQVHFAVSSKNSENSDRILESDMMSSQSESELGWDKDGDYVRVTTKSKVKSSASHQKYQTISSGSSYQYDKTSEAIDTISEKTNLLKSYQGSVATKPKTNCKGKKGSSYGKDSMEQKALLEYNEDDDNQQQAEEYSSYNRYTERYVSKMMPTRLRISTLVMDAPSIRLPMCSSSLV